MPRVEDPTRADLEGAVAAYPTDEVTQQRLDELLNGLAQGVLAPDADANGQWSAAVATGHLEATHGWIEARLLEEVQVWPAAHWLWLLRRVPPELVHGQTPASHALLLRIAEVISARSAAEDTVDRTIGRPYPVDDQTVDRLARYAVGVRLVHQIQSLMRRIKRGSVAYWRGEPLPFLEETPEAAEAIARYDARLAIAESSFLNRLGTVLLEQPAFVGDDELAPSLVVAAPALEPGWIDALNDGYEVWATHATSLRLLSSLGALITRIGPPRWWPDEVAALTTLLVVSARMVDDRPQLVGQALTAGTIVLSALEFEVAANAALAEVGNALQQAFPDTPIPTVVEELVTAVSGLAHGTWPVTAGRAVHRNAASALIDLSAATRHLELALELPADAAHAGAVSREFELATQMVIDGSAWHDPDLAAHRGEVVRRPDGSAITDLDAVGGRTGRALVVDCKSYVYRGDYEAGPINTVRNVAGQVSGKASRMRDHIVPALEEHKPAFMSAYRSVVGLVCTPVPIYTELGDATEEVVPGLPRACSLLELRERLGDV